MGDVVKNSSVVQLPVGKQGNKQLAFDGERFIPGSAETEIDLEHYHRYLAASQLVEGLAVLDVASGAGYGSAILRTRAKSVVGVDVDEQAVASARENFQAPRLTFQQGDCTDLPFRDKTFDAIVSFETIEHITEHEKFLDECRRVLKPEGLLIISTPERQRYNEQLAEPNPHHLKELSEDELRLLLKARFANVSLSGQRVVFGSLILPKSKAAQVETMRRGEDGAIGLRPEDHAEPLELRGTGINSASPQNQSAGPPAYR